MHKACSDITELGEVAADRRQVQLAACCRGAGQILRSGSTDVKQGANWLAALVREERTHTALSVLACAVSCTVWQHAKVMASLIACSGDGISLVQWHEPTHGRGGAKLNGCQPKGSLCLCLSISVWLCVC